MKIKRVEVQAFRAYLEKINGTFDFMVPDQNGIKVPANFVSLYAPNGFGKSSFYDAVEWAMTNGSERFKGGVYETAARGSKLEGEALRVLRNTEAPEALETSVSVSTTVETFDRKPGTIRRDSIDVDFKDKKLTEGADAYRRIFLSQDAIDHFIRGISPEDRYQTFIKVYGEETENLRKAVQAAYLDVAAAIEKLKATETTLTIEISKPVDNLLVDSFIQTAKELKTSDIQLDSLKEVVADTELDQLTDELLRFCSKIHDELDGLGQRELALHGLIEGLASNNSDEHELSELITAEQNILAALGDIGKLNALLKVQADYEAESLRTINLLEQSEQIIKKSVKFNQLYNKKLKTAEETAAKNLDRKAIAVRLEELSYHKSELRKRLEELQRKNATWKILQDGSANIYNQIEQSTTEQNFLREEFQKTSSDLAQLSVKLAEQQRVLSVIKAMPKNAMELSSTDLVLLGIDPEMHAVIRALMADALHVETRVANINILIQDLESQSNSFEKLATLGSEILNNHPGRNCPLCQKEHDSQAALQKAIESNEHLKGILKEKLSQRGTELNKFKELEKHLTDKRSAFSNLREQKATDLELHIKNLIEKKLSTENSLSTLDTRIHSLTQEIVSKKAITLNLEPEQLSLKVDREIKDFLNKIEACQKELDVAEKEFENLQNKQLENVSQLADLELVLSHTISEPEYILVLNYLEEHKCDVSEWASNLQRLHEQLKAEAEESAMKLSAIQDSVKSTEEAVSLSGFLNEEQLVRSELDQCLARLSELRARIESYNSKFSSLTGTSPSDDQRYMELLSAELENVVSHKERAKDTSGKLNTLVALLDSLKPLISRELANKALVASAFERAGYELLKDKIEAELKLINEALERQFDSIFQTDLINEIYRKIDPHPSFKLIKFTCSLGLKNKPTLNIIVKDKDSEKAISPLLYFSAAQLNILSLSIFLARALNAKSPTGESLDLILIDDPIHSMDSINILSTIDLLRGISVNHNKQIIISTHDENFYELLKRKVPAELCRSKFLKLESFGKVVVDS